MRPAALNPLFADVTSLPGVGPTTTRQLKRLGIARVLDAAFHLPVGQIERHALAGLDPAYVDRQVVVPVIITAHEPGSGRAPFRVRAADRTGLPLTLAYFGEGGRWAARQLPVGARRLVAGRLERFGDGLQIVHPLSAGLEEAGAIPLAEPVYGLTEGLVNARMRAVAAAAAARSPELAEWGPAAARGWPPFRAALAAAHALDPFARDRLAFDELFAGQLALLLHRASTRRAAARPLPPSRGLAPKVLERLPYRPTGAQTRALGEIGADIARDVPMLRLLQGDVGAGKTLVALLTMLAAVEAGAQAALLAPTELLARQHHAAFQALLGGLPARLAVLTGRDKGAERERVLAGLAGGEIDLVVGTHALFQPAVAYRRLALVVVDEQHRFGVEERKAMIDKGERDRRPHLLAMTATPIPRTLALTAYGEMDVSRLDEMPPGREPIETRVMRAERLEEVYEGLARHLERGGQAYWVCPLVSGSEAGDDAAAETRAGELRGRLGAERVALVHGRLRPAEKDAAMAAFASGAAGVLVATTVIEVGVDVPAATLIIIEAAERFGLAQLHQLRGRVGRGGGRSVCLLLRGEAIGETARARLALLRETTDGFRIAEEDLRLRGAGEMLGTRQAGEPAFRIATPVQVSEMIEAARAEAAALAEADPGLTGARGAAARAALYLFERDAAIRLLRSG